MKNISLVLMCFFISFYSCSQEPKCNNENVKKIALEEFKKKLNIDLKNKYFEENPINVTEAPLTSEEPGFKRNEDEEKKANEYSQNILKNIVLENIITISKNDTLKKCSCESHLKSKIGDIDYYYDAQITDDNKVYVKVVKISY